MRLALWNRRYARRLEVDEVIPARRLVAIGAVAALASTLAACDNSERERPTTDARTTSLSRVATAPPTTPSFSVARTGAMLTAFNRGEGAQFADRFAMPISIPTLSASVVWLHRPRVDRELRGRAPPSWRRLVCHQAASPDGPGWFGALGPRSHTIRPAMPPNSEDLERLRALAFEEWGPIGVHAAYDDADDRRAYWDEYDAYLPEIARRVEQGDEGGWRVTCRASEPR
jgi:hypothetical protein